MATPKDLTLELEGIWLATLRAERRHRSETMFLGLAGILSGVLLAVGLAYAYTSLAGQW